VHDEPELAATNILAHIKQVWIMGCPCLVCQRVDERKTHIAARSLEERPRPPGGFRAALRAHRREQDARKSPDSATGRNGKRERCRTGLTVQVRRNRRG